MTRKMTGKATTATTRTISATRQHDSVMTTTVATAMTTTEASVVTMTAATVMNATNHNSRQ